MLHQVVLHADAWLQDAGACCISVLLALLLVLLEKVSW